MSEKWYAVVEQDASGPALGLGRTENEAWAEAMECGTNRHGLKVVEITAESAEQIIAGNLDNVEMPNHK